jgi:hypothetical protein
VDADSETAADDTPATHKGRDGVTAKREQVAWRRGELVLLSNLQISTSSPRQSFRPIAPTAIPRQHPIIIAIVFWNILLPLCIKRRPFHLSFSEFCLRVTSEVIGFSGRNLTFVKPAARLSMIYDFRYLNIAKTAPKAQMVHAVLT